MRAEIEYPIRSLTAEGALIYDENVSGKRPASLMRRIGCAGPRGFVPRGFGSPGSEHMRARSSHRAVANAAECPCLAPADPCG